MRKIIIISWAIFAFIYVFFIDLFDSNWHMVLKIVPMFLVICLALLSSGKNIAKYYLLLSIGLIFCTIGDYTLQWFIIGLSMFLVGHLFYISAFMTAREQQTPRLVKVGLLIFGAVMLVWIAGTLFTRGDVVLAVAVCFYIIVISTMGWMSWRTGSHFAIYGSALFIVSDTILALNRFIFDVPFSHELIMTTYYIAQILLAFSISQYSEIRSKVVQ